MIIFACTHWRLTTPARQRGQQRSLSFGEGWGEAFSGKYGLIFVSLHGYDKCPSMKRSVLILLAAIACFGCNNTTTTTTTTTTFDSTTIINAPDNRHELFVLDSVLKQYETPMQRFKASVVTPAKIVGAKGTVITVVAADLETVSGKPLGNHIDIELKELTTTEELARDRAATVSDGKLLVSGGAYYINMTSGGEQLKLKAGKTLAVQFPRYTKEDMSLFYGRKDSLGQMNWKGTDKAFTRIGVEPVPVERVVDEADHEWGIEMTEAQKKEYQKKDALVSKLYDQMGVENLGWINCDRFSGNDNVTAVIVGIDKADSVKYVSAYLIFRDINCVLQNFYETTAQEFVFSGIPVDSKAALIVIGIKNSKMFTSKSKIVLTDNRKVAVKLKETLDNEVANLFKTN